jgi:hypothetical protein
MSEEQMGEVREMHNKFIKGLTWRVLIMSLIFIIPIGYQASIFIHNQYLQGIRIEQINTKVDTIYIRQSRSSIQDYYWKKDMSDKVDGLKTQIDKK